MTPEQWNARYALGTPVTWWNGAEDVPGVTVSEVYWAEEGIPLVRIRLDGREGAYDPDTLHWPKSGWLGGDGVTDAEWRYRMLRQREPLTKAEAEAQMRAMQGRPLPPEPQPLPEARVVTPTSRPRRSSRR